MSVTFFKRYRMHFDLENTPIEMPDVPESYIAQPWHPNLLEQHAQAKYESFRSELDAAVFPCLGQQASCLRLMREIVARSGFIAPATWLITFEDPVNRRNEDCATIQGLCEKEGIGSIQNVGVVPEHRGNGLGSLLLAKSLTGFKQMGLSVASLEVTAENTGAIRLYERFGFNVVNTVYKSIDIPTTV